VELLADASWVFKAHMFLGMSIFLVFPFTRLVHVWSGFGAVAYLFRPYQMVRSRRLNLPRGHLAPQRHIAAGPAPAPAAAPAHPSHIPSPVVVAQRAKA
jgi:hypothetical protein